MKKFGCLLGLLLLVACAITFYIMFYYEFSSGGTKEGQLNYITYKGYIFKTYEGKLIQDGIQATNEGGMQSNYFEFSVEDPVLGKQLESLTGKRLRLHYKEYNNPLWWRGNSKYVVDNIDGIGETSPSIQFQQNTTTYPQGTQYQMPTPANDQQQIEQQIQQLQQQIQSLQQQNQQLFQENQMLKQQLQNNNFVQ